MGFLEIITDAATTIVTGKSGTSSSAGSNTSSSWFGGYSTEPQKEAKTHDEGIFGFGSKNERQPAGTTFKAYGATHRNAEEALDYLDNTTCYSGTLHCPICRQPKNSPSDVERCKARHRRDGYGC